jgi:hypothetical protein
MNIFNFYKDNMKTIYSKQEELYILLENSSCDKYLINDFLIFSQQYLLGTYSKCLIVIGYLTCQR